MDAVKRKSPRRRETQQLALFSVIVISYYEISQLTERYFAFIPWKFCNEVLKQSFI
jgi:hypothetical protein